MDANTPTFSRAIVRKPGGNFAQGLTAAGLGPPDYGLALAQHAAYCRALREQGLELTVLEADERYPDGCFVEDIAVVAPACAILTRSGARHRRGEESAIQRILEPFLPIERIEPPGVVDGGDVLQAGDHFYIGLSGRTDRAGASQLAGILRRHGYASSMLPVSGVLHLQSGVTWVGGRHLVCTDQFASRPEFADFQRIVVWPRDAYSANCLHVGGATLMPAGFPATRAALAALGHHVIELEMSEFRKMDGGLTCLAILL